MSEYRRAARSLCDRSRFHDRRFRVFGTLKGVPFVDYGAYLTFSAKHRMESEGFPSTSQPVPAGAARILVALASSHEAARPGDSFEFKRCVPSKGLASPSTDRPAAPSFAMIPNYTMRLNIWQQNSSSCGGAVKTGYLAHATKRAKLHSLSVWNTDETLRYEKQAGPEAYASSPTIGFQFETESRLCVGLVRLMRYLAVCTV